MVRFPICDNKNFTPEGLAKLGKISVPARQNLDWKPFLTQNMSFLKNRSASMDKPRSVYFLYNIASCSPFCNLKSHRELTDVLEMHYVELPKFQGNKPSHLRSRFEKWLHVLKFGEFYADEKKPIPQALKTEEGIEMAIQALRQVNADREMRQLMEVREKERLDRNSLLRDAEIRGEARGEAKVLEEVVRKMRKKGKSPEEICEILDLDFSFVKKILKK